MDRAKRAGEYQDRKAEAAVRGRDEQNAEVILNLTACLFPSYVVSGSVGFGYVLYIRSLASFAAASSDEKIRCLDYLN